MMLKNKKSNGKNWLKLLALLPIFGIAVILNAETVTDYVYQHPQKKMTKKGKKARKVNVSGKTIEVIPDTVSTVAPISIKMANDMDHLENPLIIIDDKRSSMEEMNTLDPQNIDHITILKDKASTDLYGEEGKNGTILITTKKVVSSGDKEAESITFVDSEVFDAVEQKPEFPGGEEAMMKFLIENVRYPEAAFKAGAQGRVLVNFIIEQDGSISNAHVAQKVNEYLDEEAVRVVDSMPKWAPGMQDGKAVRVKYTLPIAFCLN